MGEPLQHLASHSFLFRDGAAPRDAGAHSFQRVTLMQFLATDDRVLDVFQTFAGGKVWEIAGLLAALSDEFAQECGWRDRGHMYSEPALHDDAARASSHCASFLKSLDSMPWAKVRADFPAVAAHMVYETWGLPRPHARERWDWLCGDLGYLYVLTLKGMIEGRAHVVVATAVQSTPDVAFSFTTSPNETPAEAQRRFKGLCDEADAVLGGKGERRGTILDKDGLVLGVEYFYRNVLKHPRDRDSIHALERDYHARKHAAGTTSTDHRDTVRTIIRRARRLLAEVPA